MIDARTDEQKERDKLEWACRQIERLYADLAAANARIAMLEARPIYAAPYYSLPYPTPWWVGGATWGANNETLPR